MGPLTGAEIASLGIDTVERLVALGWEEVFVRWIEAHPERLNVNAAVGLVAAELGVSWLKLPAKEKALARAKVEAVRREWGVASPRPGKRGRGSRT